MNYTNLVFEGGGIRGTVYIGAIQVLEDRGIMKNITRLAGSSAGALLAACVYMGYTSQELRQQIGINWPNLGLPRIIDIGIRIAKNKGIIPVEDLREFVRKLIEFKNLKPDITLKELYNHKRQELVIVSTNLNTRKLEYFHHERFPCTLLVDAVVCSMAIPLFFTPPTIRRGVFTDPVYYADPALFCSNYPIWIFNDLDQLKTGKFVRSLKVSNQTLGIRVQFTFEIDKDVPNFTPINTLSNYVYAIFATILKNVDSVESSPDIEKKSITIVSDLPALIVPDKNNVERMIKAGRDATCAYLKCPP